MVKKYIRRHHISHNPFEVGKVYRIDESSIESGFTNGGYMLLRMVRVEGDTVHYNVFEHFHGGNDNVDYHELDGGTSLERAYWLLDTGYWKEHGN